MLPHKHEKHSFRMRGTLAGACLQGLTPMKQESGLLLPIPYPTNTRLSFLSLQKQLVEDN